MFSEFERDLERIRRKAHQQLVRQMGRRNDHRRRKLMYAMVIEAERSGRTVAECQAEFQAKVAARRAKLLAVRAEKRERATANRLARHAEEHRQTILEDYLAQVCPRPEVV